MAGKTTRSDSTTTRRIIHLHHLQTKLPQRNFSAAELLEMSETSQLIVILCKTCFKSISRKLDVSALWGIIYLEEQREWIRSDGERKELTGEEREAEKRKRRRRDERAAVLKRDGRTERIKEAINVMDEAERVDREVVRSSVRGEERLGGRKRPAEVTTVDTDSAGSGQNSCWLLLERSDTGPEPGGSHQDLLNCFDTTQHHNWLQKTHKAGTSSASFLVVFILGNTTTSSAFVPVFAVGASLLHHPACSPTICVFFIVVLTWL